MALLSMLESSFRHLYFIKKEKKERKKNLSRDKERKSFSTCAPDIPSSGSRPLCILRRVPRKRFGIRRGLLFRLDCPRASGYILLRGRDGDACFGPARRKVASTPSSPQGLPEVTHPYRPGRLAPNCPEQRSGGSFRTSSDGTVSRVVLSKLENTRRKWVATWCFAFEFLRNCTVFRALIERFSE